jgi:hypothetical protein
MRAIKAARDAGIDPSAMEVVVAADGAVTYRVLGDRAVPPVEPAALGANEWDAEIAKLKATPKAKGR